MFKFISCFIVTVLYGLTLGTTLYKIPLALQRPYHIFPWEENGSVSKSHPLVLTLHIITALWLLTMTWLRILANVYLPQLRQPIKSRLDQISRLAHNVFIVVVLINCWNSGELEWVQAIVLNAVLCFLLAKVYRHPLVYFFILLVPVFIEFFALGEYFKNRIAEYIILTMFRLFPALRPY